VTGRKRYATLVATVAVSGLAVGVQGVAAHGRATLIVEPTKSSECPGARYHSIQSAIDDAKKGDTVFVCAGTYAEGNGGRGSNALTITKDLDLRGAGADQVTVQPRKSPKSGGQIADNQPNVRDARATSWP
jgi:hypothetical protein